MDESISNIRKQYSLKRLSENEVLPDAIDQFEKWWGDAIAAELTEPNAMTLATSLADATPDARIVLLKEVSRKGFTFFTNYQSQKGMELAENPRACLVFFWKELERQVRITGTVSKLSKDKSKTYFFSRPVQSQVSAIASPQSAVLLNREELDGRVSDTQQAIDAGQPIQKPDHWGGYTVMPQSIEFWQGRPDRLHDRLRYKLQTDGKWCIERLAP